MEKIITKNLLPGRSYRVRATGVSSDGKTITSQVYILKTNGKSDAPPNVTELDADFRGKTLVITWNGSAARAEKDFKHFKIRLTSSLYPSVIKEYFTASNVFNFQEDQNRDAFGQFSGNISVTVYSIDRTGNQSGGVSINASAEPPAAPTNVKVSAAVLGYNVVWDFPSFPNYKETRIYESSTQNGTYNLIQVAYGSSALVSVTTLSERWIKVSHVNLAEIESIKVDSVPPNVTPIDPVPSDVTPPSDPTNLNWEDPEIGALNTLNGITTASKRAHWQVSEATAGYKVRVSENGQNWAVYDVPALKAIVTHKSASGSTATLTVTANSFAVNDYITVFGLGSPFDGKFKVSSRTATSVSYTLSSPTNISQTADDGVAVISSYIVKELTPGTMHYGAVLAYDSANNLTQFVSQGTFNTSGTAGYLGSPIGIPGTSMAFGPSAGGPGNNGLFINGSNYWYSTGSFRVGTTNNSIIWDGVKLNLDGQIVARGGIFSGNVFINSSDASLIAATSLTVQSGSWSGGVATITLSSPPPAQWISGNTIVIAQTSSSFDGQYVISSVSGSNISFSMPTVPATYPVFNAGRVANVSRERVIFNSSGIQSLNSDNQIKFSLSSAGTLNINSESDASYLSFNNTLGLTVRGKITTGTSTQTRVELDSGNSGSNSNRAVLTFYHVDNIPNVTPVGIRSGQSNTVGDRQGVIEIWRGSIPVSFNADGTPSSTTESGTIWRMFGPSKLNEKYPPFITFETSAVRSRLRLETPTDVGSVRVEGQDFDIGTATVTFSNAGTEFLSIGISNVFNGPEVPGNNNTGDWVLGKNKDGKLRFFPYVSLNNAFGGGGGGGSTTLSLKDVETQRLLTLTGNATDGYQLATTTQTDKANWVLVLDGPGTSPGRPEWRQRVPDAANRAYTNGTDLTVSNKITYSGGAPQAGRSNGDIHFVL